MNSHIIRLTAVLAAGLMLGGCGGGSGNGSKGIPPISSVNPITSGKLQFAVGTANVYGTSTGLNVVATYRQGNGLSNVLLDSPQITGPFKVPNVAGTPGLSFDPDSSLPTGPGPSEIGGGSINSTPQGFGISAITTFGQSGGVFTNGFSPGNSTTNGVATSYVPYTEPLYVTPAPTPAAPNEPISPNTFVPWGGPPAFDPNKDNMGLRDGLSTLGKGVVGIPEGFTTFDNVIIATGTYTLNVVVPTGFNGPTPTNQTVSTAANMTSTATLPTLTSPAFTPDNKGGGSVVIPAGDFAGGISEIYIQITDFGAGLNGNGAQLPTCQGALGPQGAGGAFTGYVYYTIVAKAPGTYTLPDMDGPNTNTSGGTTGLTPSPSICTSAQNSAATSGSTTVGDQYTVQLIGLDYDMYGATFPISTSQTPTLTGANGQADISLSLPLAGISP